MKVDSPEARKWTILMYKKGWSKSAEEFLRVKIDGLKNANGRFKTSEVSKWVNVDGLEVDDLEVDGLKIFRLATK